MIGESTIAQYQDKRDFRKTPEPLGDRAGSSDELQFVIQKHDATTLHYDFRLQIDGVLVSWSIPKGPSTDPRERRLAIHTEDHPIEYAEFEGVIPEGEYGAGAVLVWDRGVFRNLRTDQGDESEDGSSLKASLEEGKVEVWLEGEKLMGGYALIRSPKLGKNHWLLVKMNDEGADGRRNPTSTEPASVLSGRTIEEIAETGA